VALVAALVGIVLEWIGGEGTPFLSIIGDVLIMGAFIIAITAFSFFRKDRFLSQGIDEIAWTSR